MAAAEQLLYTHKFSSNVIFEVFIVNWTYAKFHPQNLLAKFWLTLIGDYDTAHEILKV